MICGDAGPLAAKKYRAKAPCRAGGFFRRAGEEFEMPELAAIPAYLEEIDEGNSVRTPGRKTGPKSARSVSVPKDAQAGNNDIGAGKVTAAQDVTSMDMVAK